MRGEKYRPYSVLMSVYKGDSPDHFAIALDSMLEQTVAPHDVVVVCDGPVSPEIDQVLIDRSADVKVIRLDNNVGAGGALMAGAPHCACDVIAIMDADDISRPTRMEKQLDVICRDESIGLVGSWVCEFAHDDPKNVVSIVELPRAHEEIVSFSKRRDPFRKPSVVFTKEALDCSGGFLGNTPYYEDWDVFNRVISSGYRTENIPEVLVDVRTSEDFFSRRGGIRYLSCTWTFVAEQLRTGYFSVLDAFIAFVPHAIVVLMPNFLRVWVYKTFLRRRTEDVVSE